MDEDKELEKARAESEEQKKAIKAKEQKQVKLIHRLIRILVLSILLLVGVYLFWSNAPFYVEWILAMAILGISLWISRKFSEFTFGKYEF